MEEIKNKLNDVLFIILLNKNENFNTKAPYDLEIMGKKMWEWVELAGQGAQIKTIPCTNESNVLNLIKPYVGAQQYTMVFYSDTPLITKQHVVNILDYFECKNLNVLRLKRGYVFNSEYLKNCETIMAEVNELFTGDEFFTVENYEDLNFVINIIKNKIISFHINNGINIIDKNSTYIDCNVVIEKGTTIYPNNHIMGQSYVGENCILEPNNIIKDSIISNNCIIKNSYLSGSRIEENIIVGPYEKVINVNI